MTIRNRSPEIKSPMLSVSDGATTVGFVLARGPRGYEAFGASGKSLGLFATQQEAVRAIPKIKERVR